MCLQAFAIQVENILGTDVVEPALEFPLPPGSDAPPLAFSLWSDLAQMCSDSRVLGGMHFEASLSVLCSLSAQQFSC